ncbi:MAG: NAD(P)H-dependent oxidoreductase [Spirochaetia bacterium]
MQIPTETMQPPALLVLAHPEPRSFCSAVADRAAQAAVSSGYELRRQDLYRDGFDPVLSVEEYRRGFSLDATVQAAVKDLQDADQLIIVHPDWWGGPPAVLKGWVERAFRAGIAYDYRGPEMGAKSRVGLLDNKQVLVIVTTDSDADEDHQSLRRYWNRNVFGFCGIHYSDVRVFGPVHGSRPGTRKLWLREVENHRFSGRSTQGFDAGST